MTEEIQNKEIDLDTLKTILASMGLDIGQLGHEQKQKMLQVLNKLQKSGDSSAEGMDSICREMGLNINGALGGETKQIQRKRDKVGRNELCTCGSNKKHKKCCGK